MLVKFETYHGNILNWPTVQAAIEAGDVPAVLGGPLDTETERHCGYIRRGRFFRRTDETKWWWNIGADEFSCSDEDAAEIGAWLDRVAPEWRGGGTRLMPDGVTRWKNLPLCQMWPDGEQPFAKTGRLDYLAAEWERRDSEED